MVRKNLVSYSWILLILVFNLSSIPAYCSSDKPVSAPVLTDSAGRMGKQAVSSVFRILCSSQDRTGTCFLHKSGNLLTAAHVVSGCSPEEVFVVLPQGVRVSIKGIVADDDIDIAILTPKDKINGEALPVSYRDTLSVGAQVSTWGFPAGYTGALPMLSVGYLSGRDAIKTPTGKIVQRLVVNAAFNSGNSGGPLIDIETGTVIGIVSSKLAPIPPHIEKALHALKEIEFGVTWTWSKPDGTKGKISQSQLLEKILRYLRSQTQLVVGRAVLPSQMRSFLKKHDIE